MAEESDIVFSITINDAGTPVIERFAEATGVTLRAALDASGISLERFEALLSAIGGQNASGIQTLIDKFGNLTNAAFQANAGFETLKVEADQLIAGEERAAKVTTDLQDMLRTLGASSSIAETDLNRLTQAFVGYESVGGKNLTLVQAIKQSLLEFGVSTTTVSEAVLNLTDQFSAQDAELTRHYERVAALNALEEKRAAQLARMALEREAEIGIEDQFAASVDAAAAAASHAAREEASALLQVIDAESLLDDRNNKLTGTTAEVKSAIDILKAALREAGLEVTTFGNVYDIKTKKLVEGNTVQQETITSLQQLLARYNELQAQDANTIANFEALRSGSNRLSAEYIQEERILADVQDTYRTLAQASETLTTAEIQERENIAGLNVSYQQINAILLQFTDALANAETATQQMSAVKVLQDQLAALGITVSEDGVIFTDFGQNASAKFMEAILNIEISVSRVRQVLLETGIESEKSFKLLSDGVGNFALKAEQAGTSISKLNTVGNQIQALFNKLGVTVNENGQFIDQFGQIITGKTIPSLERLSATLTQVRTKVEELKIKTEEAKAAQEGFGLKFLETTTRAALLIPIYSAVFTAVNAITEGLKSVVTIGVEYETQLVNLRNMGNLTAESTARISDRLQTLPPVLGTTTELVKAYTTAYRTLHNEGDAFEVTRVGAALAKVALSENEVAIRAIDEVMVNFKLTQKDTSVVADALFAALGRGTGTFDQLTAAFGRVAPLGRILNITYQEQLGLLADLSNRTGGFTAAGTALSALFRELSTHGSKLAGALGDNVKQMIGSEGLLATFQKLAPILARNDDLYTQLFGSSRSLVGVNELVANTNGRVQESIDTVINSAERVPTALKNQEESVAGVFKLTKDIIVNTVIAMDQGIGSLIAKLNAFDKAREKTDKETTTTFLTIQRQRIQALNDEDDAQLAVAQAYDHVKEQEKLLDESFITGTNARLLLSARDLEMAKTSRAFGETLFFTSNQLHLTTDDFKKYDDEGKKTQATITNFTNNLKELVDAGKGLSSIPLPKLGADALQAANDLTKLSTNTRVSFASVQEEARKLQATLITVFGEVPPHIQIQLDAILTASDTTAQGIQRNIHEAGLLSQKDFEELALQAGDKFDKILASGQVAAAGLRTAFEKEVAAINGGAFQKLDADFIIRMNKINESNEKFGITLKTVVTDVEGNFKVLTDAQLGLADQTQQFQQNLTQQAITRNAELIKDGKLTDEEIIKNTKHLIAEVNKADFKVIPQNLQISLNAANAIARRTGGDIAKTTTDTFGHIKGVTDTFSTSVSKAFKEGGDSVALFGNKSSEAADKFSGAAPDFAETFAAIVSAEEKWGVDFVKHLSDTQKEAAVVWKIMSKDAVDFAAKTAAAVKAANDATNAFGNELVKTSKETQKLLDLQVNVSTPFAKDIDGLTKQLREYEAYRNKIVLDPFLTLENKDAIIKANQEVIDEVKKRILALQEQVTTEADKTNLGITQLQDVQINVADRQANAKAINDLRVQQLQDDRQFADDRLQLQQNEKRKLQQLQDDVLSITNEFTIQQKALQDDSLRSTRDFIAKKDALEEDSTSAAHDFADRKRALQEDTVQSARDFQDRINALDKTAIDFAEQKRDLEAQALIASRGFADQKRQLDEESIKSVRDFEQQKRDLANQSLISARDFADKIRAINDDEKKALQKDADDKLDIERTFAKDLATIDQSIVDSKRSFQDKLLELQAAATTTATGSSSTTGGGSGGAGTTTAPVSGGGSSIIGGGGNSSFLGGGPGVPFNPNTPADFNPNAPMSSSMIQAIQDRIGAIEREILLNYNMSQDHYLQLIREKTQLQQQLLVVGQAPGGFIGSAPSPGPVRTGGGVRPSTPTASAPGGHGGGGSGGDGASLPGSTLPAAGGSGSGGGGGGSTDIGGGIGGGSGTIGGGIGGGSGSIGGGSPTPPELGRTTNQFFAEGGIVRGLGGTDSELAHVTPGELVIPPQHVQKVLRLLEDVETHQFAPNAPRVNATPQVTNNYHMPITLDVTLPQGMNRLAAQDFVDNIIPALQQAIDRHQLNVKGR